MNQLDGVSTMSLPDSDAFGNFLNSFRINILSYFQGVVLYFGGIDFLDIPQKILPYILHVKTLMYLISSSFGEI